MCEPVYNIKEGLKILVIIKNKKMSIAGTVLALQTGNPTQSLTWCTKHSRVITECRTKNSLVVMDMLQNKNNKKEQTK